MQVCNARVRDCGEATRVRECGGGVEALVLNLHAGQSSEFSYHANTGDHDNRGDPSCWISEEFVETFRRQGHAIAS